MPGRGEHTGGAPGAAAGAPPTRAAVHRLRFLDARPSGGGATALHPSGAFLAVARESGDIELWACDAPRFSYAPELGGNANTVALGQPVPWAVLAVIPGSAACGIQALTWARAAGSSSAAAAAADGSGKPPGGGVAMGPTAAAAASLTAGSDGPGLGGCRLLVASLSGALYEADWTSLGLVQLGDSHGGAAWSLAAYPLLTPSSGGGGGPGACVGSLVSVGCEDGTTRLWVLTERGGDGEYGGGDEYGSVGASAATAAAASCGRLEYASVAPGSDGRVLSQGWHPTLPVLFTGTSHGVIRGWDVSAVTAALTKRTGGGAKSGGGGVSVSSNLAALLSRANGTAAAASPSPVVRMQLDSALPGLAAVTTHGKVAGPSTCVWALAVTADLLVVTGDSKGSVLVWDGRTGTLAVPSPVARHDADVLAVAVAQLSPSASASSSGGGTLLVASAGVDGRVSVVSRVPADAPAPGHRGSGAAPGPASPWRWVPLGHHRGHGSHDVRSLALHPSGTWLASTSADGFLCVIGPRDVNARHPVRLPPFGQRPAPVVAFAQPPELLAATAAGSGGSGGSGLQAPLLVASLQATGVDVWAVASAPAAPKTAATALALLDDSDADDGAAAAASAAASAAAKLNDDGSLAVDDGDEDGAGSGAPAAAPPAVDADGQPLVHDTSSSAGGSVAGGVHAKAASRKRKRDTTGGGAPLQRSPLHSRLLRVALDTLRLPGTGGGAVAAPEAAPVGGKKATARTGPGGVNARLLALAPSVAAGSGKGKGAGAAADVDPFTGLPRGLLAASAAGAEDSDEEDGAVEVNDDDEGIVPVANPVTVALSGDGRWLAYATAAGPRLLRLALVPPTSASARKQPAASVGDAPALAAAAAHAAAASALRRTDVEPLPVALPPALAAPDAPVVSQLHFCPLVAAAATDGGDAASSSAPQLLVAVAGGRLHVCLAYDAPPRAPAASGKKKAAAAADATTPTPVVAHLYSLRLPAAHAASAAVASGSGSWDVSAPRSTVDALLAAGVPELAPLLAAGAGAAAPGVGGVKIASAALTLARQSLGGGSKTPAGGKRGRFASDASALSAPSEGEGGAGAGVHQSASFSGGSGRRSLGGLLQLSPAAGPASPIFVTALASAPASSGAGSTATAATLAVGTHEGHVLLYAVGLRGGRLTGLTPRATSQPTALALVPSASASSPLTLVGLLRSGGALAADGASGRLHAWSGPLSAAVSRVWHSAGDAAAAAVANVAAGTGGGGGANGQPRAAQTAPSVPRSLLLVPAAPGATGTATTSLKLVALGPDASVTIALDFGAAGSGSSSGSRPAAAAADPVIDVRPMGAGEGDRSRRVGGGVGRRAGGGKAGFTNVLGAALVAVLGSSAASTAPSALAAATAPAPAPPASGKKAAATPAPAAAASGKKGKPTPVAAADDGSDADEDGGSDGEGGGHDRADRGERRRLARQRKRREERVATAQARGLITPAEAADPDAAYALVPQREAAAAEAAAAAAAAAAARATAPAVALAVVELPWRTYARHLTTVLSRKRYGAS
jgi:trimeric autotransporter adhesin